MNQTVKLVVTIVVVGFIALAIAGNAMAAATPVTIPNYSFEDDPPGSPPTGWQSEAAGGAGNPVAAVPPPGSFPVDSSGNLPAPALGTQALWNAATAPSSDAALVTDPLAGMPGTAWRPSDDNSTGSMYSGGIQPGYSYTYTIAVGQSAIPNSWGWDEGFGLGFAYSLPGSPGNGGLIGGGYEFIGDVPSPGTFKDYTVTMSGDWQLGPTGNPWRPIEKHGIIIGWTGCRPGDDLRLFLAVGADSYIDNVRVTATSNYSLYWTGGGSNTWSDPTVPVDPLNPSTYDGLLNWVVSASGPDSVAAYNQLWASGCNAIFQGPTPGTIAVTGPVGSVNSITFNTDGYTLNGAGTITMTGAGGAITTGAGTDTISCAIAGSVGLTKNGAGTLVLTGANAYTGDTTINTGTLQVGDGGTTGNICGNVNNNGALAFNRSDTVTYTGNITGGGQLIQQGSGTTILTGAASHTGGTTINAGTLQIGNGGTTGSVAGDIANYGALVFNRSDTVVVTGGISGSGSLTQAGSGRVILTGPLSYTGVTNVQNGALQVNNVIPDAIAESSGVNVTGGFLVLDYSAGGVSVGSAVQAALKTAYGHGFTSTSDPIYNTSATSSIGLGWVDNAATKQVTIMPAMYGDANLDGVVGLADLNTLLTNYGKSGMSWSQGDFNYDGIVGLADLNTLLTNYGKTGPLQIANAPYPNLDSQAIQLLARDGITFSGATAVPEPSSLIMLAALAVSGAFGVSVRARRKRKS